MNLNPDWTTITQLTSSVQWRSITYGNGKFVIIPNKSKTTPSDTNIYAYSTDGINWTQSTLPISAAWLTVSFLKDKFILLAGSRNSSVTDLFLYSFDGINWTQSNFTTTNSWSCVCYSNNVFVAIGTWLVRNVFNYSYNGITWYATNTVPSAGDWNGVTGAYINGKNIFIAVNSFGGSSTYSYDGITWFSGNLSSNYWFYVKYFNEKFVAAGQNCLAYSTDGINWTDVPSNFGVINSMIVNKNGFLIFTNTGPIKQSNDGINWSNMKTITTPANFIPSNGYYINNKNIVFSSNGYILSLDDSNVSNLNTKVSLTSALSAGNVNIPSPATVDCRSVIFDNKKFLMPVQYYYPTGNYPSITTNLLLYSYDGINWSTANFPTSGSWYKVAYGDNRYTAIREGSNKAAYSYDGINWNDATLPSSLNWRNLQYGKGKFVTIAGATNLLVPDNHAAYSYDGKTWNSTTLTTGLSVTYLDLTYGNDKFVAVGRSDYTTTPISYSTDGINWSTATATASSYTTNSPNLSTYLWQSVVYGGDKFLALGYKYENVTYTYEYVYAYSYDGITWSMGRTYDIQNTTWRNFYSLTYGNGMFFAKDFSNTGYIYSYDGINWTNVSSGAYNQAWSCAYGKDKFIMATVGTSHTPWYYIPPPKNTNILRKLNPIVNSNWTTITQLTSSVIWCDMTYGNGKFATVARSTSTPRQPSNVYAYSTDGINWTQSTLPISISGRSIKYLKDRFFICNGNTNNKLLYSYDCINWNQATLTQSTSWSDISYNGNIFVIINTFLNIFNYSYDGITWYTSNPVGSTDIYWYQVTFGNVNGKNIFVAVGPSSNIGPTQASAYSYDGITWYLGNLNTTLNFWFYVKYFNGTFVAAGQNCLAYSTDGINWTVTDKTDFYTNISTNRDGFLIYSYNPAKNLFSKNGIDFTSFTLPLGPATEIGGGGVYQNNKNVYVNWNGIILSIDDSNVSNILTK